MLTDDELNQMLADAAEMQRLRDAATEWLGNFTVSEPYGYDAMFCDVTAEGATVPCIQGCHHTIVELLAAASRSDKSAAHVERLVQEVRRLNEKLSRYVATPSDDTSFLYPDHFEKHGANKPAVAEDIIEACHIHGVPVPPHLKPYEENAND